MYGKAGQLPEYLRESGRLLELKTKDNKFWLDLIQK